MPKFIVLVHATNFLFSAASEVVAHGAYTARVVRATDPAAAEGIAYASVEDRIRTDADFVEHEDFAPRFETVVVKRVHGLRKVRGYALILYEQGDEEARVEAQSIAEEGAKISTVN
jgi:hypothetical protein